MLRYIMLNIKKMSLEVFLGEKMSELAANNSVFLSIILSILSFLMNIVYV